MPPIRPMRKISDAIIEFFKLETASSILLIIATIIALLMSNLHATHHFYHDLIHTKPELWGITFKPLEFWVNDGLMVIFFLLVGLELKRERVEGELSELSQVTLPAVAAIGGMLVPALIYVFLNWETPETIKGWAIPSATDIAFSLGVLALLGSRIPLSLKVFLMALAIIDDIGAILIIALFYSTDINVFYLAVSGAIVGLLWILNRQGIMNLGIYLVVGFFLLLFAYKSGIHDTIAGVVLALFIPIKKGDPHKSPLHILEHNLHPWVAYGIVPIFAFTNAGVSFEGMSLSVIAEPVPLGIILGLFLGKQIGVFLFTFITIKLGFAQLPEESNWGQIYGVALLCGIGFTMSLFIGSLAFGSSPLMDQVRLGVLFGSLLSAVVGYIVLWIACSPTKQDAEPLPST